MRFLLDTNVLQNIHLRPALLGKRTVQKLQSAKALYFSPLTIFEWLQKDDYLGSSTKKLAAATKEIGAIELPLTANAALEAIRFGSLRGSDPFDFLMLSQAAEAGLDFLTPDSRLLDLGLDFVLDAAN